LSHDNNLILTNNANTTEIMDSTGKVQPAVLLKADGAMSEVKFDTTPRLKEVNKTLGCDQHENITFAGQWEDVVTKGDSVLLILRFKAEELKLPINQNKLQPPFHEAKIPGDILLQRSDENGNVLPFTLKHYKNFQKKEIKEWTPADDEVADDDEDDDEDSDDDDEEDEEFGEEGESDDEDDEEEDAAVAAMLDNVEVDPAKAQAKLLEFLMQYAIDNNGATPSEEELQTIKGTIYYMLAMEAAGQKVGSDEEEDEEEDDEEEEEE
jgi:hypothetical protein